MSIADQQKVIDVFASEKGIEIYFAEYSYEGPRNQQVILSFDDAIALADLLLAEFSEVAVPEGSIVFSPERPSTTHLTIVDGQYLEDLRARVAPQPADYELPACDGYCADCNHTCANRGWKLGCPAPTEDNAHHWCLWAHEPMPLGHSHPHQVEGS